MIILSSREIAALLASRERELVEVVKFAYLAHSRKHTSLPHSVFLRFPHSDVNRIIALPAYLGEEFNVAGVKWISSFPGNVRNGLPRASAVIVLNDMRTGVPIAMLEGALISAKRTAASAVLAAGWLCESSPPRTMAFLGGGRINQEIAGFVGALMPSIESIVLFDPDGLAAHSLANEVGQIMPRCEVTIASRLPEAIAHADLVSIATTASRPYLDDAASFKPGAVVLHVSLRDFTAEAIHKCWNLVDDVDHVCRESTSLHKAAIEAGHHHFIAGTLAELIEGRLEQPVFPTPTLRVFSPFGLGVLDLAVASWVVKAAEERGLGQRFAFTE
ncbi:2,3-diaminopropionate biosynthesis protein SbnB [Aquabacterium sp. CECT 9606]|uniref:2,3-diaminopropionate biosynthesis protein SbnB n=1 Tax=Aquabacterium sp. CECT 9606 TaxID=2845822 RepID=UPI001E5FEE0B|nr:2,3-diaminopropionate biosynthesis protein SbnB [Aquabacterium sp. CECT 9606]CAH0353127.1 N-((2S)-2-amino-2-carboxyethyl)-L-glutamate dehydrogenase [Aquabacterium sp. CECT 9606]